VKVITGNLRTRAHGQIKGMEGRCGENFKREGGGQGEGSLYLGYKYIISG